MYLPMLRAPAADMAAAVRGEKQQDEKNIMEDQEDWQEHPWDICKDVHETSWNIHRSIYLGHYETSQKTKRICKSIREKI